MVADQFRQARADLHRLGIAVSLLAAACGPSLSSGNATDSSGPSTTLTSVSATSGLTTASASPSSDPEMSSTISSSEHTGNSDKTSTSGGGCSFISCQDPDCDPFMQNCPEGQKCVPYSVEGGASYDAVRCVEVTGERRPGEPCTASGTGLTGFDDCIKGAICFDLDQDNHGYCISQCTGSYEVPVCPDNVKCVSAAEQALNLCFPPCDPLQQDCPRDELCVPIATRFICALDGSAEDGQVNDPCGSPNACDKGLFCHDSVSASAACDPVSSGCCQPFCKFPDATCPNPDQKCMQWFNPALFPPNDPQLEIGVCAILE